MYLEAPNYLEDYSAVPHSVFLAGSISNCWDWQSEVSPKLLGEDITVFNPRRREFDMTDPDQSEDQISWEFAHLEYAKDIIFWFSHETVAPISLFELGKHYNKTSVVGIDPKYPRQLDLEVQLRLMNMHYKIVYSLDDLVKKALCHLNSATN